MAQATIHFPGFSFVLEIRLAGESEGLFRMLAHEFRSACTAR
jgi:hypothetical protein